MKKIKDNVYVESEISVCNSSIVVTKEGVVVIDTPMVPESAKKWAKQAESFGPVRYVINTEPHGDHISGNCYFGGTLIAHDGTRDAILASKVEDIKGMLQMWSPGVPLDKDFRYRPPDITLSQHLTFYLGGLTFNLINMPGHSPYQVAVYIPEERIVFTSDNISRAMPFFRQALPDIWLKTLKELEKLDVDYVVPGHGEVGDKSVLKEMYKTVTIWINTVKEAIKDGMTLEEAQKNITMAKQFPDIPRDERTAGIITMNVGAIYQYYMKR
jgi:glyoxylase-like metal-dependent hydrolase (beta-lactamase superfamily II)